MKQQEKLTLKDWIAAITFMLALGGSITLFSDSPAAQAGQPTETLNHGYVGCVSEEYLTQYNASVHRFQVRMMTNNLCIPTSNLVEFPYVVLSSSSFGVRKVRLMLPDDQYADLFVPIESTMRSLSDVSE